MSLLLAAATEPPSGVLYALVYFLIAFLVLGAIYYGVTRFAPQATVIVGIVLAIVLLLIALKLFGGML
jgi:hypothetical protein